MNEQEEFQAWWDQDIDTTGNPYSNMSMMYWAWEAWKAAKKVEREACAKLSEEMADWHGDLVTAAFECAAEAIRKRGQE